MTFRDEVAEAYRQAVGASLDAVVWTAVLVFCIGVWAIIAVAVLGG